MPCFGRVTVLQTDGKSELNAEAPKACTWGLSGTASRAPTRKSEQASIEAFNAALRREEFGDRKSQVDELELIQRYADEFLDYYHNRRPHLSLEMLTPAQSAESHLPLEITVLFRARKSHV